VVRSFQLLKEDREMADQPQSGSAQPAPAPDAAQNKAQAEFQRYKERLAQEAAGGANFAIMPGWALPPSLTAAPGWHHGMPGPMFQQPAPMASGSLRLRLGSTLRLGVDFINSALAGGVRVLSGIGAGYEMGWPAGYAQGHGHGCGCGSCGHDCCDYFGCSECCRPGVGSCC
jgi:hypothetical protein